MQSQDFDTTILKLWQCKRMEVKAIKKKGFTFAPYFKLFENAALCLDMKMKNKTNFDVGK